MNSAANFVFTSKTGLPRVVLVLRWVLFVPEIFVSPLSEFEQHMYSSDPRPDTGSLMQLENRRAVHRLHRSHNPKPRPGHFNNSPTRWPRSEKPALQKRPLFVLFPLVGGTAAILNVAMSCAVEGAQCKTRELPYERRNRQPGVKISLLIYSRNSE